jgi:hypothetical protein
MLKLWLIEIILLGQETSLDLLLKWMILQVVLMKAEIFKRLVLAPTSPG